MLRVKNLTQNQVLVAQGRVANNPWRRFRGLMGVHHLAEGDGLLIEPCDGVHTHFMRIPIDVLYVDKMDRIVHIDPSMKPWKIGQRHRLARYVIEMPSGVVGNSHTVVGDLLKLTINQ